MENSPFMRILIIPVMYVFYLPNKTLEYTTNRVRIIGEILKA